MSRTGRISGMTACLLAFGVGAAGAQPGQTPPGGQPPPGTPPPSTPPAYGYAQPPPGYPPHFGLLTEEERELVLGGEITPPEHIVGGLVGTFFGFGLGHPFQGRYLDRGWIFTVGEGVSFAVLITGAIDCIDSENNCDNDGTIIFGALAFVGFRIWELVDIWFAPLSYNDRVRAAQYKAWYGAAAPPPGYGLFVVPTLDGGAAAGLRVSF